MSRKLNLVIDFNNMAMRSMFTCQYMGEGSVKNFDTEEECKILVRKLATDMCQIIKMFSPDRVIVACDTKSPWRTGLYKDVDYKGTRKHDEDKNWTNIFSALTDYKEILRKNNFIVTEIENAEADDLAALWVHELFGNRNESVILVSSDKDWTQLVAFGTCDAFVACYNPISNNKNQRKFYVESGFENWINSPDTVDIFFSNYDELKKKLKEIMMSNTKVFKEIIDPNRVLIDKILCGDDGDNVPSFYEYYKSGKKARLTSLKASHLIENLSIHGVGGLNESAKVGTLKTEMEKEMKVEIPVDFEDRLMRQRKLVELNRDLFPGSIVDSFDIHSKYIDSAGTVSSKITMQELLKDTKFIDKNYNKPRENSIFDDVNALNRFSKAPSLF